MNGSLVEKLEGANGMFETVQNYDCVFMSETWTNENSNVEMNGSVSFCKHRKRKNSEERIIVGDMISRTEEKQECLVVSESDLCSERELDVPNV